MFFIIGQGGIHLLKIKDLLLKTRGGQILVARDGDILNAVESVRTNSEPGPVNLQVSPSRSDPNQNPVGIPIPKNFLPSQSKVSGNVETSLYQCNLCMVTFKSLESIEIHQSHYCKNTKHPRTEVLRPNSTVVTHAQIKTSPGQFVTNTIKDLKRVLMIKGLYSGIEL